MIFSTLILASYERERYLRTLEEREPSLYPIRFSLMNVFYYAIKLFSGPLEVWSQLIWPSIRKTIRLFPVLKGQYNYACFSQHLSHNTATGCSLVICFTRRKSMSLKTTYFLFHLGNYHGLSIWKGWPQIQSVSYIQNKRSIFKTAMVYSLLITICVKSFLAQ